MIIVLGTAHLSTTPGKCSPDGRFREFAYSREIALEVAARLRKLGHEVFIDYVAPGPNEQMKSSSAKEEQRRELAWRVSFVNTLCARYGTKKVIYVSLHTNAADGDGKWHGARGLSVMVSPKGSQASRRLARCIYEAGERRGKDVTGNRCIPQAKYWEQNLCVLNNTRCPAVLTESLFQDNRDDVEYLLSSAGREAVTALHVEGIVDFLKSQL